MTKSSVRNFDPAAIQRLLTSLNKKPNKMFTFIFRISNLALYHELLHLIFKCLFYTLIYLIFTVYYLLTKMT